MGWESRVGLLMDDAEGVVLEVDPEPELELAIEDRSTRRRVSSATEKSSGLRNTTMSLLRRMCVYCCTRNCLRTGSTRLDGALPFPLASLAADGRTECLL